ncbi:MAG TPA: ribokinase [Candidatus Limnocylindrales bacterium]|nr:ribokinase [Candidatus Limnocylindrales bacterium]
MGRVIVVGSLNIDLVVRAAHLPAPGQTVTGQDLVRHQGGKGGNQAVAAARMGAQVAFVGAVGQDELGQSALQALRAEGIATEDIVLLERPTGVALIVVDRAGQNQIAVAPGANAALDDAMVESALEGLQPTRGDVVLASREIPDGAVRTALARGRQGGALTVLNPAPADGLDPATRQLADLLTPNETEVHTLSGVASSAESARRLLGEDGTSWLAVTLGAAGAELVEFGGKSTRVPAPRLEPVDTTGAGDTFNGALAALLAEGMSPPEAVGVAVLAASLSTQRAGAREGMPSREQLGEFVRRRS